jgi:DNA-binding beta-propeller fold protein YncE
VALSPDGLMAWIADLSNNRIALWTRPDARSSAWANQTSFGTLGTGMAELKNPNGVTVTPNGLLALVSDNGNNRMSVWTRPNASGTWTNQTVFGSPGSGPTNFRTSSAAISNDGLTAWIADYGNNRISIWTRPSPTSAFSHLTNFGSEGTGLAQFKFPADVVVTPDGLTLLVADSNNNRISVWSRPNAGSTAWAPQTTFGSGGTGPSNFFGPSYIALSADGLAAWITNIHGRTISVWNRPNATSTLWANQAVFSSEGTGPSNTKAPAGLAVPADGRTVLVADRDLHRISVWDIPCPA